MPIWSNLRFTRLDTGAAVEVACDLSRIGGDARMRELMPLCLVGRAVADEIKLFRALWQNRVRRVLLDHADDSNVTSIFSSTLIGSHS